MDIKIILRSIDRKLFPKKYKHMSYVHKDGRFEGPDENGVRQFRWQSQLVYKIESIKALKQTCSGPCFIVATGPSIKSLDLNAIVHLPIIGVNGAIRPLKEHGLSPSYYMINDLPFYEEKFDFVREVLSEKIPCIFSAPGIAHICSQDPGRLKGAEIYFMEKINHPYGRRILKHHAFYEYVRKDDDFFMNEDFSGTKQQNVGFSKNIEKGYFEGRTVVYFAIQAAYYMGFDEVYILGMDLGLPASGDIRAYDEKGSPSPSGLENHYEEHIKPAFITLREFMKTRNFAVYNVSESSRLPSDIVPKLSFDRAVAMASRLAEKRSATK